MSGVRPGGVQDSYVAPLEANRRGAHRARPNPLLGILPLVAVAAVVVAVAGGVVALVGGGGLLPSGKEKTVAGSTIASAKPTAKATTPAAKPSTPAAQQSSPSTEPSKTPDASPSKSADVGTVDKTVKITVHNSTSVGGLAKKTSGKLKDAGWTGADYAKGQSAAVPQTIVYYASSDLKATAEALVQELGVGVAKQTSKTSRTDGSGSSSPPTTRADPPTSRRAGPTGFRSGPFAVRRPARRGRADVR
jgi:hypothetical protein